MCNSKGKISGKSRPMIISRKHPRPIARKLIKLGKTQKLATGITTGYEVADNQMREFVLTKKVKDILKNKGINSELIFINDTLDPFKKIHFRRLINFDENLKDFKKYLGWPVCEIPSPYGDHQSLASFFQKLLVEKLKDKGISVDFISTHKSYDSDFYYKKKKELLLKEQEIIKRIDERFDVELDTIYRPICDKCNRIDKTIMNYKDKIYFCQECGNEQEFNIIPEGKFIWKIDSALRWNYSEVEFEPFTKHHLDKLNGTYYIASFVSKNYLDGFVPATCKYSQYRYNSRTKNIFSSLPYELIEKIYLKNIYNKKLISNDKIINKAKNYIFGKFSFYKISLLISIFYPYLDFNNRKKINHINKKLFDMSDSTNEKVYNTLKKRIMIARNFARNFMKAGLRIMPLEKIKLENYSRKEIENSLNILKEEEYDSRYINSFYKMLFGRSHGPSIDTIQGFIDPIYKKNLIKMLEECYENKTNQ